MVASFRLFRLFHVVTVCVGCFRLFLVASKKFQLFKLSSVFRLLPVVLECLRLLKL